MLLEFSFFDEIINHLRPRFLTSSKTEIKNLSDYYVGQKNKFLFYIKTSRLYRLCANNQLVVFIRQLLIKK